MPTHQSMHSTPEDIEEAFYEALELGDLEVLMRLWAEDEHIVCIHPGGGRLEGYKEIRDSWRQVFESGLLQIRLVSSHRFSSGLISVHNVVEQVVINGGMGGSEIVQINSTNVYHKGPNGWKLVIHHSSQASEVQEISDVDALDVGLDDNDDIPVLH